MLARLLILVVVAKAVVEISLLGLLGQWVLGVLSSPRCEHHPFYRVLRIVGQPGLDLAQRMRPRRVLDNHHSLVPVLLLAWAWMALTLSKVWRCLQTGVAQCQ